MKMKEWLSYFSLFILMSAFQLQALALVDYTDPTEIEPDSSGASSVRATKAKSVRRAPRRKARENSSGKVISLSTHYSSQDVDLQGKSGKVSAIDIEGRFQTAYNIFLEFGYWQSQTDSKSLDYEKSWQKGNPKLVLGFNWLQFGGRADAATVDLIGGIKFKQSNSDFASSRTDRIVGVTTAKRFHEFGLGIGYELSLTGDPSNEQEMQIGTISKLGASLGWVVSGDIRILLEANTYSISPGNSEERVQRLTEKVKFSTLNPKMYLTMSPGVELEMGAVFRTRRLKDKSLTEAKLWDIQGAYGNSLYAGLGTLF